jgi:MarR family 2-MHQ and catechol resistance regulon transcriptional repressor
MKDAPALDAYVHLLRAASILAARVARRASPHGLPPSRIAALCALQKEAPMCPRDIACRLGQTRGNVTMILDDLERRGLVERRREGINRRFRAVHLTPRGRKLIAALRPRHARAVAAELGALAPRELRALARLCAKLDAGSPTC